MNENIHKYLESLARLGRDFCSIQNPKCGQCPMNKGCKFCAKKIIKNKGFFRS